jgi:hypothetical protein
VKKNYRNPGADLFYGSLLADMSLLPLHFTYGGRAFCGLSKDSFQMIEETVEKSGEKETRTRRFTLDGVLEITVVLTHYYSHGATEWTAYFANASDRDGEILENVYSEQQLSTTGYGRRVMSASVYISALGYRNISLAVTDAGYLKTNIGSTGKAFYIGTERCAQIVSHIESHYEGVAYESALGDTVVEPEVEMTPQEGVGASTPAYDPRG